MSSGRGWWEQDGEEVCSVGASKEVCPVGGAGGIGVEASKGVCPVGGAGGIGGMSSGGQ